LGFASFSVCVCSLWGQATSGSISGNVTDLIGAAVPQATVKVTNEATDLARESRTSDLGSYSVPNLPPGTYSLSISKIGFRTFQRRGIELRVDDKLRVDSALALGLVSEAVNVTGLPPILQTQTADTGQVIQSRYIVDLPLLGKNFLDLARLTAGVTSGSGGNNVNLSVNGQREFANSIVVDGVEVTANRNNDTSIRPSVDSVEEFKVVTSGYAPEFGNAAGAVVAIQAKSGTNQHHGDLYEFFRPNNTAARSFFSPEPSALKQHNFGGTLGGPIRKDRTFFFGSYEGQRLRDVYSFLDSVPPAGQIKYLPNGDVDLSGLRDPFTGNQIPVFDPEF
jgi:hypothetical protein